MKRITNLEELDVVRHQKRSIVVPGTVWDKPRPAAFVMNLQGHRLLPLFRKGMYLYEKPKKAPRHLRGLPPAMDRLARESRRSAHDAADKDPEPQA